MSIKANRNDGAEGSRAEYRLDVPLAPGEYPRTPNSGTRFAVLLGILLLSICALSLTALLVGYQPSSAAQASTIPPKIDPLLTESMQLSGEDELLRIIVYMEDSTQDQLADLPDGDLARRSAVADTLQQAASASQEAIVRDLQRLETENHVTSYRSLWIINGLQVSATAGAVASLASRADVARVGLDSKIRLLSPITATERSALLENPPELPWSLRRTRVPHVWAGLGITGTGVTVAIMDTGADWLHPALQDTYRSATDELSPTHKFSWFDAVEGAPVPFDPNGHGTHVVGTASGRHSIGVAPGSRWMAVRVLDEYGFGYLGDIHAGFQWILAPAGDPSKGPDIVNGSWSGHPELDAFVPDIEALHAAGIITVFSAGNSGPEISSIGSPASYSGVVAVGASDDIDKVAWFSSRGPSTWTSRVKPTVIAPGTQILSSLPGGQYGHKSGTSMSAPHVAGLYALLLSAEGQLSPVQATNVLTATAILPARVLPNDDTGWGLIDAYAAASSIVAAGRLRGIVQGDAPLSGLAITITTPAGVELGFFSSSDGSFAAELISGTYKVEVAAFGYQAYVNPEVIISHDSETELNIALVRLPHGKITGQLLDLETGLPLSGVVRIDDIPWTIPVGANGLYEAELPVGQHELVAWVDGHRLGRFTAFLSGNEELDHDFFLPSAPKILLIDSGQWYGNSREAIYAAALQDNDFSFSTLSVRDPFVDRPTLELLSQYEVIVWSAPQDSPGMIGAGEALSEYLANGGNVLVAGQDTAAIDESWVYPQQWWYAQLRGLYQGKANAPFELTGEPGSVFEDLRITLEETDDAGEAIAPDASVPSPGALTEVSLRYADGNAAGLIAGQCESFRLAHLGFGLQDVGDPVKRADLMARTLDFFDQPETVVGVVFDQPIIEDFVPPGGHRSYHIQVVNLSETLTDTIGLEIADPSWSTRITTDTLELGPCESGPSVLEIDIPADAPRDSLTNLSLVASSQNYSNYEQSLEIRLKTPGHILLVDDDRWYDQASVFKEAMNRAGLDFDFWEIGSRSVAPANPPLDLLSAYDFVVWYTGYDWFRPITAEESEILTAYIDQGGRLFLTSQDYLYYHFSRALTRSYFGVLDYAESITPTIAYGGVYGSPFAELVGPQPLDYGPYQNHGDGLVPGPQSVVSLWHDQGYAAGVANSGSNWRTVFWGLPFETLPAASQARSMNRILGWLSDLGESSFLVDSRSGFPSDTRAFTLTLRYSTAGPGSMVAVTNSLPLSLSVNAATINGASEYDPDRHQITWRGRLDPGQQHEITYEAIPRNSLPPGMRIENFVEIYYEDHDLLLERTVPFWLAAPDLAASRFGVSPAVATPGQIVTYELKLFNQGTAAGSLDAKVKLPEALVPLTGTVNSSHGEARLSDGQLDWHGRLRPGEAVTVTTIVRAPSSLGPAWLPATAILEDGVTDAVVVDTLLEIRPYISLLPVVARSKP